MPHRRRKTAVTLVVLVALIGVALGCRSNEPVNSGDTAAGFFISSEAPTPTPEDPDSAEGLGTDADQVLPPLTATGCGPNGYIRDSCLAPIAGGRLLKSIASRWNAMNVKARSSCGLELRPLGGLSSYRNYAGQVYLYARSRPGWAARPGTSNHGWGTTVDLGSRAMRACIDRIGAFFGFSKRCSDAAFEWWHMRGNPTCTGARWSGRDPGPSGSGAKPACAGKRVLVARKCRPILRRGSRGKPQAVRLVQRTLRNEGYCAVRVNGHYDRVTRSRVKSFQRAHGLRGDAVIGTRTWRKIERYRGGRSRC